MSSKKLFQNGEAAPEGSVGRHGNPLTNRIVLALSGLAAVVSFVTLLFMLREIAFIQEQQTTFMREIQDQQTAFQTDLREELQAYLKDQVLQMQLKQKNEAKDKINHYIVTLSPATYCFPDCAAVKAAGHTTSGVYTLGPPLSGVEVYCDMDTAGGGWTVIQRRIDGSVPFDLTWEDYKHGFGNKNGEYWLGNEIIHRLTTLKDFRLRIDMMDWEENERYAEYGIFRVLDDASNMYRLAISGYSGTAGDSMIGSYPNNGQLFSTVDRDNDVHSWRHCSQVCGHGGWWYRDCGRSFLNGRYLGNCGNSCPREQGVVWYHWRGPYYSLKSVSMKIRPR
ncbi:PREDICTED: microfibril-associated glycoprotein 4-like [Branchiostoma belcheri]|uniref:Microfibril-associated glycoprotein 4-like n=1 Tax=Branchiostoma belcheri TaxID=7741 RepID=A0A6P5AER1_BRABE|nr:PREDICTED: microfibril-associated glycoprotein 4-like [Branchiostoma belcheri]